MFRIAAQNEDKGHPDSARFAIGGTFDDIDAAQAKMADAVKDFPKKDGYVLTVEELVPSKSGDTAKWEER